MLEYEWGNPSTIMLSGDQPTQEDDPARQIFDYSAATANQQSFNQTLLHHQNTVNANVNAFSQQNHFHNPAQAHLHSIYDLRAYSGASAYGNPHPSLPSLDSVSGGSGGGYVIVPKREEITGSPLDFTARIGLNLGRRTYFSSAEDEFVNRLYRRSRAGDTVLTNSPRCQAEGCHADLTHSKHYHRRHKVCEFHSKAATVIAAGLTQRFCQQCSRFENLLKCHLRFTVNIVVNHTASLRLLEDEDNDVAHRNDGSTPQWCARKPMIGVPYTWGDPEGICVLKNSLCFPFMYRLPFLLIAGEAVITRKPKPVQ
ncbi:hypothetical protein SLEP1_g2728 [Rubroshorea leprosula]|uniref:SBP-type domain-containing protein n=1 Tax=Rubroshorea leprosula TaxID=152421 RepID=A0AAV5HTG0_9ROSI|nr:hypothetical protein SLEP1_g2728 [Rubroshorea leprosula]